MEISMDYKLYHDNSFERMSQMEENSVDLIVTDPPYLHVKGGMKSKRFNVGNIYSPDSKMVNQLSDFDHTKINAFLNGALRVLKKANIYIFCSKLQLIHYFEYISEYNANHPKSKALKYDLLVWDKLDNKMMSSKFFASDIEYIIRIYEPGVSLHKIWNDDKTKARSDYYMKLKSHKKPNGIHTTQKPIELITNLVEVSSLPNDVVFDPFMGSGTTGVVCKQLGRQFIGIEIDKDMFDKGAKRIRET